MALGTGILVIIVVQKLFVVMVETTVPFVTMPGGREPFGHGLGRTKTVPVNKLVLLIGGPALALVTAITYPLVKGQCCTALFKYVSISLTITTLVMNTLEKVPPMF